MNGSPSMGGAWPRMCAWSLTRDLQSVLPRTVQAIPPGKQPCGKKFKPVSAVLAAMGCGGRPTQFSFARGSPFRLSTFGQNGKNSPCGKEFKPVSAVLAAAALVCPRLSETAKTARKQTAAAKNGCAWHRRKKKKAPVKPELSQR